jgi:AcrR family transcriptional regulator
MARSDNSNSHQARTQATRAKLLAAAETVFVRDGFEGAQLEEIALMAGRTKGSVYANFKGKEDLFLALFEERAEKHRRRLFTSLAKCKNQKKRLEALKKFFISFIQDGSWPLLILEFKLYSIRHPESNARLQKAYDSLQRDEDDPAFQQVFGVLTSKQRHDIQTAIHSISPILGALLLEKASSPKRMSGKNVADLITRIFDSLFQPS